mgnify:FL=1
MKKFLKKYLKYRKEDGYILVCDCSCLKNYKLPLLSLEVLDLLSTVGFDPDCSCNDMYILIFEDLDKLNYLDTKKDSSESYRKNWTSLGYQENEFFK